MAQNGGSHHSPAYRPDIDGLRAISVMFVIASHTLRIEAGNTGVDIFFVISGYVITMTMIKDYNQGTYSIVNFYARRIKRILPVLILSTAVFLALTYYYFNEHMRLTADYAVCNLLMVQNFCLFRHYQRPTPGIPYGIFNLMNQNWTLGLEEQFYAIWPLIMAVILRAKPKHRVMVTGMLTALSFMQMISPQHPHIA